MDDLSLLVLAPQARVDDGVFAWDTPADAIRRKVRRRVEDTPASATPGSATGSNRPCIASTSAA